MANLRIEEYPVVWFQGGGCSGCSVSVLNTVSPSIKNLLIDEVVPGKHVSLKFHPTIMAGAGRLAIEALERSEQKGGHLLVVEGAINEEVGQHVAALARKAMAAIALGTCASFGGIPAARPNPGRFVSLGDFLRSKGISTPLINIPGCPPHPDWFVQTVAGVLLHGLPKPADLDEYRRPKIFFGQLIHENCPRRAYYDEGKFAKKLSDPGCLYELGCKGPVTYADCPIRLWNGGVNWCIGIGSPCIGCCEPGFPDQVSPLYEKMSEAAVGAIGGSRKEV